MVLTTCRAAVASVLLAGLFTAVSGAQESQLRMIIASGAVCRAEPRQGAAPNDPFRLGDIVTITKQQQGDGGAWGLDETHVDNCWVPESMTAPFSPGTPDDALIAMIEHIEKGPSISFEQFVEVSNLLEDDFSGALGTSSMLQYHRLKLIAEGLSASDARESQISREPLKKAWILSHQDLLKYYSANDSWGVRPLIFWRLYDGVHLAPWADELAQTAALKMPYRPQGSPEAILTVLYEGPAQYWSRLANGAGIGAALQEATAMAKRAADNACPNGAASPAAPHELVEQIRGTLFTITAPQKGPLMDALAEVEKKCAGK